MASKHPKYYDASDVGNVIVHLSDLQTLVDNFLVCKRCRIQTNLQLRACTIGIATRIKLICTSCKNSETIVPETIDDKYTSEFPDPYEYTEQGSRESCNYRLNIDFTVAMQFIGGGMMDASLIAAMLNLSSSKKCIQDSFTLNEEFIGMRQVALGKTVLQENLQEEIAKSKKIAHPANVTKEQFSKLFTDQHRAPDTTRLTYERPNKIIKLGDNDFETTWATLRVAMDTGWQKRSSGRRYDSSSGQHTTFGYETRKLLHCVSYSTRCAKCKSNRNHPPELCSLNYTGSAKGMEGTGAIQTLTAIAATNTAFVGSVTMDDDSSMRRNMRHSWQAKIDAGIMDPNDWPKTAKGNKRADGGLLPLAVPEPVFLADFNHRTRTLASELFALARAPKKKITHDQCGR